MALGFVYSVPFFMQKLAKKGGMQTETKRNSATIKKH